MTAAVVLGKSCFFHSEWQWYFRCVMKNMSLSYEAKVLLIENADDVIDHPKFLDGIEYRFYQKTANGGQGCLYLEQWSQYYNKEISFSYSGDLVSDLKDFDHVIFLGLPEEAIANGLLDIDVSATLMMAIESSDIPDLVRLIAPLSPMVTALIFPYSHIASQVREVIDWSFPVSYWAGATEDFGYESVHKASPPYVLAVTSTMSKRGLKLKSAFESMKLEFGVEAELRVWQPESQGGQSDILRREIEGAIAVVIHDEVLTFQSIFLAWGHRIPILVNRECEWAATTIAESKSGLCYDSFPMLRALLCWVIKHRDESVVLAVQGHQFLQENYLGFSHKQDLLNYS